MPTYSIDTSSLVAGWSRLYPPDTFPGFWEGLSDLTEQGIVVASREVLREIERRDDALYEWCKDREHMFVEVDEPCQDRVIELMEKYPRFVDTRSGKSVCDPFVIALADIHRPQLTVVTEERGGAPHRPKIPIVCVAEKIKYISLLEMIQKQGWRFFR
jgi:hypothetical protein